LLGVFRASISVPSTRLLLIGPSLPSLLTSSLIRLMIPSGLVTTATSNRALSTGGSSARRVSIVGSFYAILSLGAWLLIGSGQRETGGILIVRSRLRCRNCLVASVSLLAVGVVGRIIIVVIITTIIIIVTSVARSPISPTSLIVIVNICRSGSRGDLVR